MFYTSIHLVLGAVKALHIAIEILTEKGRFHTAAGHQKALAEIYESDLQDREQAMHNYQKAGDWYSGEDSRRYTYTYTYITILMSFIVSFIQHQSPNISLQIVIGPESNILIFFFFLTSMFSKPHGK